MKLQEVLKYGTNFTQSYYVARKSVRRIKICYCFCHCTRIKTSELRNGILNLMKWPQKVSAVGRQFQF